MTPKEFGKYMKELREKACFNSMEDLSKASGISAPTIHRIENGMTKEPGIETLIKLAKPLNVSHFDLLRKTRVIPDPPKPVLTLKALLELIKDPKSLEQLNLQILIEMQSYINAVLDFSDQSPLTPREFQQLEQYKSLIIARRKNDL